MPAVKKTFRINEIIASELEKQAKKQGISQTEFLERAIQSAIREPYTCHTDEGATEGTVIEVLREQLLAKDEQIASMSAQLTTTTKALLLAQEQIGAAQLLHAADRKDDLLPKPQEQAEEKPRQGFFARLFGRA